MRSLVIFQICFLNIIMCVFYFYPIFGEKWYATCSMFLDYYVVSTFFVLLLYTQTSSYKNYIKKLYFSTIHLEYIRVLY